MTDPSRAEVRHSHGENGYALVADTDDIDIYTLVPDTHDLAYVVRVLDCDGTRLAHDYIVDARGVVPTVAHHLDNEEAQP